MDDPYRFPTTAVALPGLRPFGWRRVLVWAGLIYLSAIGVGLASGLSMGYWEIYGSTMEEAVENARLVRRVAYGLVGALLYWGLAVPVQKRLLHVVSTFVVVQLIDLAVSFFVFNLPADELFDTGAMGRGLLAAACGLGLAWLSHGNAFRPKPERQN